MGLEEQYDAIYKAFLLLNSGVEGENMDVMVGKTREMIVAVREASLYSENEEMEEIQTPVLKFLFLEYYLGKMLTQQMSMELRLGSLKAAKMSLGTFLQRCFRLQVMNEEDVKLLEIYFPGSTNGGSDGSRGFSFDDETEENLVAVQAARPRETREMKIAKFKKEKEDNVRIEYLQGKRERRHKLKHRNKGQEDGEEEMLADLELGDEEEELRELYLLQLSTYMRKAIDEIPLLNQELQMLQHMEKLRKQQPSDSSAVEKEAAAKDKVLSDSIWQDPVKRANILHLPGTGSRPNEGESRGIEVTRTGNTPDGSLMMTKETVKAGVFRDSIAPPTMTVEQFGELEKVSDTFISLHYYSTWCAIVQFGSHWILSLFPSIVTSLGTCPQERGGPARACC